MRLFLIVAAAATVALLFSAPASSHAVLRTTSPADGSVMAQSPAEIRLRFNEAIEPRFSRLEVTSSRGARIKVGTPSLDPQSGKSLVVALPPLGPGAYTVKWRAISVDTHRIEGQFRFEIRP